MKTKTKTVTKTYYVSDDGIEFSNEGKCFHHEEVQKGNRRNCNGCQGTGQVTKTNDYAGDGNWGSPCGVSSWKAPCDDCDGRGYLTKQEVWK